jgi:hypothetical protein
MSKQLDIWRSGTGLIHSKGRNGTDCMHITLMDKHDAQPPHGKTPLITQYWEQIDDEKALSLISRWRMR